MTVHVSVRLIVRIAALVCGPACGVAWFRADREMMDRVNEKPGPWQSDPAWWYFAKLGRLSGEYKKLYPDGPLRRRKRTLAFVIFACYQIFGWGFAIIAP